MLTPPRHLVPHVHRPELARRERQRDGPSQQRLPVHITTNPQAPNRIHPQHRSKAIRDRRLQRALPRMDPAHRVGGRMPVLVQKQRDGPRQRRLAWLIAALHGSDQDAAVRGFRDHVFGAGGGEPVGVFGAGDHEGVGREGGCEPVY